MDAVPAPPAAPPVDETVRPTAWWKPVLGVVLPLVIVVPLLVLSIFGGLVLGYGLLFGGPVVGVLILAGAVLVRTRWAHPSEVAREGTPDALIAAFGTARQRFHLVVVVALLVLSAPALGLVVENLQRHLSGASDPRGVSSDPLVLLTALPALGLGPMLIVADLLWALSPHITWVETEAIRTGAGRRDLIRLHRTVSWIVGVAAVVITASFVLLPVQ